MIFLDKIIHYYTLHIHIIVRTVPIRPYMRKIGPNAIHEDAADNHALHELFEDIRGTKVLKQVIDGLRQQILLYRYRQLYEKYRFDQSIQEHGDLLETFRKTDARLAETTMQRHLMDQCKALVESMSGKEENGSNRVEA